MILPSLGQALHWAEQGTGMAIAVGIAAVLALGAHFMLFGVLDRITRLSPMTSDEVVVDRLRQPLRWSLVAIAIALAAEGQPMLAHVWESVARFVVPALLGWVAFSLVKAFATAMTSRAELSTDEFSVRSRRTRIAILSRSLGFVIIFVTVALMLLGIPGVRNVGVTLMASAGVVSLAVGVAAQPALKSLIAGIQMALTEPMRIGDLIVIDNETGRVEDVRMTYVVIRTADERRLIVPTAKFLDTTFQNWTRVAGGLTGTVLLPIVPGHAIAPIRMAYEALLKDQPEWDERTGALQVAEIRIDTIELKLIMSARNPTALTQLRLAVREGMLEWLRVEMPEALRKEI